MTQKVRGNWHDPRNASYWNDRALAMSQPGVKRGLLCKLGGAADRVSITAGALMTHEGIAVEETTDLTDYFSSGSGRPLTPNVEATDRIDLIVCNHQYAESFPDQPTATFSIIEGTAGALDFDDLPATTRYQTIIGVARMAAGGTGYELFASWPITFRVNHAYDHATGLWKVATGAATTIRVMIVPQDFADLFGWEPGIRVDMIASGEKADGATILETDWVNAFSIEATAGGSFSDLFAEIVAARGSRDLLGDRLSQSMETNGDLLAAAVFRQWILDFIDKGPKVGMRVHHTGDSTAAETIDIEPGSWISPMGLRVELLAAIEEEAIPANVSAYARWDLVTGRSVWTQPGQPAAATYQIVEGTPSASPAWPDRPANDTILAYGYIEAGATTYRTILNANIFKHHNCYTDVDHTVHILDGKLPAWIIEYQPNTEGTLSLVPWFKLYMHPGGVADDAAITVTEVLKITEDGLGELVDARGTFSTLAGRLNVSLNANGTLKANTVGASQIVDASVGVAEISSAIAGDGLSGGAGSALSVNVDDSTIEKNADALRVKGGGIGPTHLSVDVAGDGLTGGLIVPLSVVTDGETTNIDGDGAVAVIGLPNNLVKPHHRVYPVCARYHGAGQVVDNEGTESLKFATTDFERLGGVGSIPTYAVVDNSGSYTEFQNKDAGVIILEPSAIWRITIHIDLIGLTWTGAPAELRVFLKHTESDGTPIATYRLGAWENGGGSGINDLVISASTLLEMAENDKLYFEIYNYSGNDLTLNSNNWVEFELLK